LKLRRNFTRIALATLPALALATAWAAGPASVRVRVAGQPGLYRSSALGLQGSQTSSHQAFEATGNSTPPGERSVDLDCSVVRWETADSKPILTLACQAAKKRRLSALRVYIQLSWMGLDDQPKNYREILAPPQTLTRLHSDSRGAFVWLKFRGPCDNEPCADWVRFSELVHLETVRER
jgi:hypothetical protein